MSEQSRRGIALETRTTCKLQGVDDSWDTADMGVGGEVESAIETVAKNRDEEVVIPGENLWMYKVYWNENTDSVWVSRYGYNGGMEVDDERYAEGESDE